MSVLMDPAPWLLLSGLCTSQELFNSSLALLLLSLNLTLVDCQLGLYKCARNAT